jgi:elongation factor G
MEKYLEGTPITEDEIRGAIRKGTLAMTLVPVLCGSAFKNRGVQLLLDAVVEFLPSPLDVPPVKGVNPDNKEDSEREAKDNAPVLGARLQDHDRSLRRTLTFFRVYSGVLTAGGSVYNSTKTPKERIGRLLKMHANKREEIKEVYAGDIAAAVGLRSTTTGDTLCDEDKPIILESIEFPDPVIDVAIEPKTKDDQEKLGIALQEARDGRPVVPRPVRTRRRARRSSPAWVSSSRDHRRPACLREFKVDANVGKPQVAYRETIRSKVEQEGRFVRQTGGRGQYGHVWITLEPLPPGGGFEFKDGTKGAPIPKEFVPAVEKGIREAFEGGVLAGYPLVDVKAVLTDGSYHDVDSSEIAFKIAGSMAAKEGAAKAKPIILEPIMAVEVGGARRVHG